MFATLRRLASRFFTVISKEQSVLAELHRDVQATLAELEVEDPGLKSLLDSAYGYAVFPAVGKATAVLGGAFGKGEVFQRGKLVGYCAVAQLTIGVQLGGQTFSEIIVFRDKAAADRFKAGRYAFAANASAVLVKAGAAASVNYEQGAAVLVHSDGGMMLELAIGGQKFFFAPAGLGRGKKSESTEAAAKRTATQRKDRATSIRAAGGKAAAASSKQSAGGRKPANDSKPNKSPPRPARKPARRAAR